MGTLAVAAIVIRVMRQNVELLIARLYDSARSDQLTQLTNRRGFREALDLELVRARRRAGQSTVIVGDIDRFKEVNDRSGHQVGDAALQLIVQLFARGKRDGDALARVGRGEFALVLPDTDQNGAFVIAERLRSAVRVEFRDRATPITISFAVASYPRNGETAAALLRASGEALQAAKRNGGDRTMLHTPAMHIAPQLAGLMRDIGKVGVPDSILQKPGSLSDAEFEVIRRHPELGAQMLDHPSLADVGEWVGAHHERPDGRGYPNGLRGDAIPLEARILAVADAYEAMTSDRSYRSSLDHAGAKQELERCAGTQFDVRVVRALIALLDRETESAVLALGHS